MMMQLRCTICGFTLSGDPPLIGDRLALHYKNVHHFQPIEAGLKAAEVYAAATVTAHSEECIFTFPCKPLDKVEVDLAGSKIIGTVASVAVTAANGHNVRVMWLDGNRLCDEWFPAQMVRVKR